MIRQTKVAIADKRDDGEGSEKDAWWVVGSIASGAIVMVLIWGVASGEVPVCVQIWMFNSSRRLYEAMSTLVLSAFQFALGAGTPRDGVLVDRASIAIASVTSTVFVARGAAPASLSRAAPAGVGN